ncbi:MAG TPA: S8 family serine peptidase, partial [Blastocatellia bacterium]|nr:S8 family serine peptidase [Blastocatellia bacterium]
MYPPRIIKKISIASLCLLLAAQSAITIAGTQKLGEKRQHSKHAARPKLAPDLAEGLEQMDFDESEAARGGFTLAELRERRLKQQKRIAQASADNEMIWASNELKQVIVEVNGLATSSTGLDTAVSRLGGRIERKLEAAGLVSITLPAGKIRQLAADPNIAYVSPDRPVEASGHLETTTAAAQIRSLVSGTTLDGRGIGIAIIDSGIDDSHGQIKAATNHPGVVGKNDYTNQDAVKDHYGHGTHVAGIVIGGRQVSNGAYGGIA